MVRLIPGNMLPPGDYQVGVLALPPTWFRFSVSGGYSAAVLPDLSGSKSAQQPNIDSAASNETTAAINNSDDAVVAKCNGFEIKRSQLDEVITGLKSAAATHGQTISA